MQNIALLFTAMAATALAAPIEKRSDDVQCKVTYSGELELWMNKPDQTTAPVISDGAVAPYGETMLLYNEKYQQYPKVNFVECNLSGDVQDESGSSDTMYGRIELADQQGMCIEHLPTDDPKKQALGVQKCDNDATKNKSDKQAFKSYWDGKSDISHLSVLDKDMQTFYTQWRSKDEGDQAVLTLSSTHPSYGKRNVIRVKNVQKN